MRNDERELGESMDQYRKEISQLLLTLVLPRCIDTMKNVVPHCYDVREPSVPACFTSPKKMSYKNARLTRCVIHAVLD